MDNDSKYEYSKNRGHTVTLLNNGKVLVTGGYSGTFLSSAEIYDPNTGKWTTTGSMINLRSYHTATLLPNGKVLVTGGQMASRGSDFISNNAEIYDPATGKWTATQNMITKRSTHAALLIKKGPLAGKVLVTGGQTGHIGIPSDNLCGSDNYTTRCAEIYDPNKGTWSSTGSMVFGSYYVAYQNYLVEMSNGLILLVGGDSCCSYHSFSDAQVFDSNTQTWSATSPKATYAQGPRVLLTNGNVLLVGGQNGWQGAEQGLASAEEYNPNDEQWIAVANMSTVRAYPTLTVMQSGKVLVAGGNNGIWGTDVSKNSAEIYNPATHSWSNTGAMNVARASSNAVLLVNGTVLVTGGFDNASGTVLASAELYSEPNTQLAIPLGASVDRIASQSGSIVCTNLTTGNAKILKVVKGATSWDCEKSGLIVNKGDKVQIKAIVNGIAK